jgi:hypothetical protein
MHWGYCCNSFVFTNFRIDMIGFMDLHKVVVKRNAFLTCSSAWKWKWMMKQKVKSWSTNFHKWKRIWTYKRCLNWFPFQRKTPRKKKLWYLAPLLMNYTQWVCIKPSYTLIVLKKECFFQCEEVSNSTFNLLPIGPSTFDPWILI